ncbi:MAG: hypothetical protein WC979_05190 [Candidatus Pacearchaeota archaeon]|jgi:predicted RND superfamily exporter protein
MILRNLNKKADLSVLLLVFMAVFLSGFALYMFNVNSNTIKTEIKDSRYLDDIYVLENNLDFYINEIMDQAVIDFRYDSGSGKFVERFNEELQKYNSNGVFVLSELNQINLQVINDNVELNPGSVSINFNIKLEKVYSDKFNVTYNYNKKFSRKI